MDKAINFTIIKEMIPDKGELHLILKKAGGNVIVCYSPKYEKTEQGIRPLTMQGTPEELTEAFEKVKELSGKEKTLTATEQIEKRKAEVDKAIKEKEKKEAQQVKKAVATQTKAGKQAAAQKTEGGKDLFTEGCAGSCETPEAPAETPKAEPVKDTPAPAVSRAEPAGHKEGAETSKEAEVKS